MKWKCLTCRETFPGSNHHAERCPVCGSAETIDCNVEPVPLPLVMITGELPLALTEVPFSPGQVVRLGRREMPQGSVLTAEMFSNYMKAMRGRW